jgi:hypothetical protein
MINPVPTPIPAASGTGKTATGMTAAGAIEPAR